MSIGNDTFSSHQSQTKSIVFGSSVCSTGFGSSANAASASASTFSGGSSIGSGSGGACPFDFGTGLPLLSGFSIVGLVFSACLVAAGGFLAAGAGAGLAVGA